MTTLYQNTNLYKPADNCKRPRWLGYYKIKFHEINNDGFDLMV